MEKKLSNWNYDVKNKIYFPVFYKQQFEQWLKKNKKIGLDFMSVNERTKLNHILFWALCFQVTEKNYYLDYIYDELLSFKKVYKFGKGVAYYTTLNVSQRLINLSFTNNLLFENKNYNEKLNFLIEKIMYSEFQYVCKQNTGFYLKRNNHYISELLSIICYLKCSIFKYKSTLLKEYENKFNKEIDLQIDKEGGTLEGSLAYSAYILEMLFIGYFLKITNNKDKLKLLYNWIKGMSNEEGILAGFGDVAPEKAINLNPDEKILNKSTLFNLIDFMLVSKTKYNLKKTYLEYFYLFYGKRVLNFKKVKFKNETILKKAYTSVRKKWGTLILETDKMSVENKGVHGHCDQGSYVFFAPEPIICDPGTYSYFLNNDLRNYFRKASNHNLSYIKDCNYAILGNKPFDIIHNNKFSLVEQKKDTLKVKIEGFDQNKNNIVLIRKVLINKKGFRIIDEINLDKKLFSNINFHPQVKLKKISDKKILINKGKKKWNLVTHGKLKMKIFKYNYSDTYLKIEKAERVKIYNDKVEKKIDYEILQI